MHSKVFFNENITYPQTDREWILPQKVIFFKSKQNILGNLKFTKDSLRLYVCDKSVY